MNMTTRRATVPAPKIYETMKNTANFSCESNGRPLSLCLWSHTVRGEQKVILINKQGGNLSIDGIHVTSAAKLNEGKCSVRIEAVTEDHFGVWACTLMSAADDGEVWTGEVELREGKNCAMLRKDPMHRTSI